MALRFGSCLQTVSEVFECLTNLVRKSLVIADTAGQKVLYRLLDLPRAFAREKLGLSGELAMIKRRHAQMWCTVGAAAAGARPRWIIRDPRAVRTWPGRRVNT
jgi:predicted ATPase